MRIFISLIFIIFLGCRTYAFNIVYPKHNSETVNANSIFFIGSSKEPLKINGQSVPLHSTGAFAYVVNLKEGVNTFVIKSNNKKQIFIITKPKIKSGSFVNSQFKPYNKQQFFYVTTEGCPLRSTPVDGGINRMVHLQRNIPLTVDGEKNGFYRVILSQNNYAWISKTAVKEFQNFTITSAKFLGYDYIDSKEYFTFVFHLDKQVPYEIKEGEFLSINFFNVSNYPNNTYTYNFSAREAMGGKKLTGYKGEYVGNDFILKIRKPPFVSPERPLRNIKIAVDAGHGGSESGAIGCLGDKEKDITLSVAKYLEVELKKRGAKVIMTRNDDSYIGLNERVNIANNADAQVFVSIHGNALPDGADPNKISGTSVFYYYNQAKPLAQKLLDTMILRLGTNNDHVRQASFAVVRNTEALSVLIEIAYLINPEDNAKLADSGFQMNCAKAIAEGLEKYFSAL